MSAEISKRFIWESDFVHQRCKIMRLAHLFGFLLVFPLVAASASADVVIDETTHPKFLFVMSAKSGSFEANTLTLTDVPAVVYFSDRPARIAGHTSVQSFVDDWFNSSTDSLAKDPPNATLSVLGKDAIQDSVMKLVNVSIDGGTVHFTIQILEGSLPEGPLGPMSLFIDEATTGYWESEGFDRP
ncbi:MAG: hypothetical protein GY798_00150 [Hyphomicrobiales bacterium]|nr:hypothetical protein [Hyphomicrobiales bacterium]